MNLTLSEIGKTIKQQNGRSGDYSFYGVVSSLITSGGTVTGYNVAVGDSTIEARKMAGANVGDIVLCTTLSNGITVVTGALNGDKDAATAISTANSVQSRADSGEFDGANAYFHMAWANSADGTVDFSTTAAVDKLYMGTYSDDNPEDSLTPSDYIWIRVKGERGQQGEQGEKGDKGDTGDDGVSITRVVPYFYASTSNTTVPPYSFFSTANPTLDNTSKYLWKFDRVYYSDGSDSGGNSEIRYVAGAYGDKGDDTSSLYMELNPQDTSYFDAGLAIFKNKTATDANKRYVLINDNGVDIYQGGKIVSHFGNSVILGDSSESSHILLTDTSIVGVTDKGTVFDFNANGSSMRYNAAFNQQPPKTVGAYTYTIPNITKYLSSGDSIYVIYKMTVNNSGTVSSDSWAYSFYKGTSQTTTINRTGLTGTLTYDGADNIILEVSSIDSNYTFTSAVVKISYTAPAPSYTLGIRDDGTVGAYSYVVGYNNVASGTHSYAEGENTAANGYGNHAEGGNTTTSGYYAHAQGYYTTASDYAHAEGAYTTANGSHSHAEGWYTTASGSNSHAGGQGTTAAYSNQTAIGKYNVNDSSNVFEIGWGTSNSNRKTVFAVGSNGNATATGTLSCAALTVGGTPWTTTQTLTVTHVSNNYVANEQYGTQGIHAYKRGGVLYIYGNMRISSSASSTNPGNFINIAKISGWNAVQYCYTCVTAQDTAGVEVSINIGTGGNVEFYTNNIAGAKGKWVRFSMSVPAA